MSRPLTYYFKTVRNGQAANVEKRKMLQKSHTPLKSSKKSLEHGNVVYVDLVSDDDETSTELDFRKRSSQDQEPNLTQENYEGASNSSASTIIYTPETPRQSATKLIENCKTPASRDKFYSPVKKMYMKVKSPEKVKKILFKVMDATDPIFEEACLGMDDKTVFLLTIINKCLNNKNLRELLLVKSQNLLSRCLSSRKPGTRLVCRLYWRKEGWYTFDQVKKISSGKNDFCDNSTIQEMINNLIENGIIESANIPGSKYEIGFEDCVSLLKKDELKAMCRELKLKGNSKQEAMESLRVYSRQTSNISNYFIGSKSDNASRVSKMLRARIGPCYRLTEDMFRTLKELHILMYLGIDPKILQEKKLELMLINDKSKRECYPVDKDLPIDDASVVFTCRETFEQYLEASDIYEEYLATTDLEHKCRLVETVHQAFKRVDEETMLSYKAWPPWLRRFAGPHLLARLLDDGVQALKRGGAARAALALDVLGALLAQDTFRQRRRAHWCAEKALILDKFLSRTEEAARVLLGALRGALPPDAVDELRPRAARLARRAASAAPAPLLRRLRRAARAGALLERDFPARYVYKVPMDLNRSRGKMKFETRTADGLLVQGAEDFCIAHYLATGDYTHGEHWEGSIATTVFFLLFWDIIYARPPGVRGIFLSHYQKYPLDMFLDSFYENRRALIEERLETIEESTAEEVVDMMHQTWVRRPENEVSGVGRRASWPQLRAVCDAAGPRGAAALCRRVAAAGAAGFPDLTLWHERRRQVKFVEVKTDADRPSASQLQWLRHLRAHGLAAELCYVGVHRARRAARARGAGGDEHAACETQQVHVP